MIIPIRCYTCGKVLADKYETYKELIIKYKGNNEETLIDVSNVKKTAEGKALDQLELKRYCCRNIMLSHVDLIDVI